MFLLRFDTIDGLTRVTKGLRRALTASPAQFSEHTEKINAATDPISVIIEF